MSGPPSWLWWLVLVSAGVGGLCVVVGVVSAVVDWLTPAEGSRSDSLPPLAASQPDCDPESGAPANRLSGPP